MLYGSVVSCYLLFNAVIKGYIDEQTGSCCLDISIFGGHKSLYNSLAPKFGGRDWLIATEQEAIVLWFERKILLSSKI